MTRVFVALLVFAILDISIFHSDSTLYLRTIHASVSVHPRISFGRASFSRRPYLTSPSDDFISGVFHSIESPNFPFHDAYADSVNPYRLRHRRHGYDDYPDSMGFWTSASGNMDFSEYGSEFLSDSFVIEPSDMADEALMAASDLSSPPPSTSDCEPCGNLNPSGPVIPASTSPQMSSCQPCKETVLQPPTSVLPKTPVLPSQPPPSVPMSSEMPCPASTCINSQDGCRSCQNGVETYTASHQEKSLPPPPTIAFPPSLCPTIAATSPPITSPPSTVIPSSAPKPSSPVPIPSPPPSTVMPPSSPSSCPSCASPYPKMEVPSPTAPSPITLTPPNEAKFCQTCNLPLQTTSPLRSSISPVVSVALSRTATPNPVFPHTHGLSASASQGNAHPYLYSGQGIAPAPQGSAPNGDIGSQHPRQASGAIPLMPSSAAQSPAPNGAVRANALPAHTAAAIPASQSANAFPPKAISQPPISSSRVYSALSVSDGNPVVQPYLALGAAPESPDPLSSAYLPPYVPPVPPSGILFANTSAPPPLAQPAIPGLIAASGQL